MVPVSPAARYDSFILNYTALFAFAILYYDHFLTFFDEVHCIWKYPRSLPSIGFLVNRYLAFFGNITLIATNFITLSLQREDSSDLYRQLLIIATQTVTCILLLLRTYALYNRSRRILALLLSVGVAMSICGGIVFLRTNHVAVPSSQSSIAVTRIYPAALWEIILLWDFLIFTLTIYKTHTTGYNHKLFTKSRLPLLTLLFRDGAIYFGVIFLANLANILTFYLAPVGLIGCLSTFANSMSVTMMSRLMLNLHECAEARSIERSDTVSENWAITSQVDTLDGLIPTDAWIIDGDELPTGKV